MKLDNQTITALKQKAFNAMESMKGVSLDKAREIAIQTISELKNTLSGFDVKKFSLDALQMTLDDNIKNVEILQKEAAKYENQTEEAARLQKEEMIQPFFECLKIAIGIVDQLKTL